MKTISIVIPVRNNPDGLELLLNALLKQSYPKEYLEIIIIDNNSDDKKTLEVAQNYKTDHAKNIQVFTEKKKGSYAARNTGIHYSHGEVIALIDSDCIPTPEWLINGITAMEQFNADIVGGRVRFLFSNPPGAAEIYDSLIHMQMQYAIEKKRTSPTANLFVHREVFSKIGLFPSEMQSGGDTIWTATANSFGFKLLYAANAEVLHPARNMSQLLIKRVRVGSGHYILWTRQNKNRSEILTEILRYLLPPRPQFIRKLMQERGTSDMEKLFWSVWIVAWACRYATNIGRILFILKKVHP
jgi:glycosyltransferase involved in cell wall biosynthesis